MEQQGRRLAEFVPFAPPAPPPPPLFQLTSSGQQEDTLRCFISIIHQHHTSASYISIIHQHLLSASFISIMHRPRTRAPSPTLSPTDPVPRGQLWPTGSVGAGHRVSRR